MFIAGLMVGRTPEYLGKKIEAYDVKMAMLVTLVFPLIILALTAVSAVEGFGTRKHQQCRPARTNTNSLRLHIDGRKQRFRVCRIEWQHALVQHRRRNNHADRAVFHGHSHARHCRQPGEEKNGAASAGTFPVTTPLFALLLVVGDRDRGCTYILSRTQFGTGAGTFADDGRKNFLELVS